MDYQFMMIVPIASPRRPTKMTDDSIKNGDDETKAILNEMSVEQLKAKLAEKDKEMAELNKMLTDEEKHLDACRIVYKKDIDEKDKEILHQKKMIICLKSGCVEVPNPNFDGPNRIGIPGTRLIRGDAPKKSAIKPPPQKAEM